MIVTTTA